MNQERLKELRLAIVKGLSPTSNAEWEAINRILEELQTVIEKHLQQERDEAYRRGARSAVTGLH